MTKPVTRFAILCAEKTQHGFYGEEKILSKIDGLPDVGSENGNKGTEGFNPAPKIDN